MCWGEEPVDIVMFIIKLLLKWAPETVRWAINMTKMFMSLALDFGFALTIYDLLIGEHFSDEVQKSPWPYIGYAAVDVLCMGILVYQCTRVASDKMPQRTFFLTYKAMDFLLGCLNAVGLIYTREELDFDDVWQMAIVVFVGCDVVVNPVQMIIAGCCARNESD